MTSRARTRRPAGRSRTAWIRPLALVLIFSPVILTSGCSAPPRSPSLPLVEAAPFSTPSAAAEGIALDAEWWRSFDDASLTAHIEDALRSNFTLQVAFERLRAARAIAGIRAAERFPTVDAFAGGTIRDGDEESPADSFEVGLEASYELDLWGRVRAAAAAETLEATATAEDVHAAAVSLSAEIATALYRAIESGAQLALIDAQLATNRNVLRVIESRFAIGQSGSADVLRQRQLVEATAEQRLVEETNRALLEHRLRVLRGLPPQGVAASVEDATAPRGPIEIPDALPVLPDLPAVGLPSDLLQRRPDLRAALARLASADATVAAAVKDRYPRIDLAAAVSSAGEKPSELFRSWISALTAQLVAPLIDGGARRREVDRTEAVRAQRLAEVGEVVLVAYQEVEDALVQERQQAARIASLERQLDLANRTATELRNQYLNGAADFIDVLSALRDQQALEREVLAARRLRIEFRIALHRAIAGGFLDLTDETEGRLEIADDPTNRGNP